MKFNVITGLPRAGSTLLCNIFNQNPKFHATSTSTLSNLLSTIIHNWSNSIEIKNLLEKEKEQTEKRIINSMRALINEWHKRKEEVIFDKSREWNNNALLLKKLFPDIKIIVMIRDLRNVFASIEKQHKKNPLLDEAQNPNQKTIFNRADQMFSPEGIIGAPILGIEDLIRRQIKDVIYVNYESFSENPKEVMKKIYKHLEEDYFEHDFKNVEDTSNDPDGFYLHKYPHKGCGEVKPCNPDEWKEYVSPDLANIIMNKFGDYNRFFGYIK